jgi:hypothetical protein
MKHTVRIAVGNCAFRNESGLEKPLGTHRTYPLARRMNTQS